MKRTIAFVSSLIFLFSGPAVASSAERISNDPVQIMNDEKPASGARGIVFVENAASSYPIGFIRYSHIPVFKSDGSIEPSNYWSWKKCSSWSDQSCQLKTGHQIEGRVFLGTCTNTQEIGCIESFKIINSSGVSKKITLIEKYNGALLDTPQDLNLGVPRSSSPSVYRDEDGNYFVVRAGFLIVVTSGSETIYKFDADITPVDRQIDASLSIPKVENSVDPRTGLSHVGVTSSKPGCLATDIGVCFKAKFSESDDKYSLSVRVPRGVSGWLRGRISEANFDVQPIDEKSQLISMTGKSVKMPIAGGWVDYSQLPNGFIEKIWPSGGYDPNPNASYFLMADPAQGERSMQEYAAWLPYLKEKALTSVSNWSFGTNMSSSEQSCLKSTGEISGFVASNASVYSSRPPEWDPATSSLTYKVAAPHLDELGNVNQGTYTLAMPLKSIQCLYGQSDLPPSATVSIAYGSEVKTVATVSLKSDSGWIFFAANGFHYSAPSIVVKFSASEPVSAPSPAASPAPKPDSVVKTAVVKRSVWCAKGATKRKVTATKPVCPKGFKKIAAPIAR